MLFSMPAAVSAVDFNLAHCQLIYWPAYLLPTVHALPMCVRVSHHGHLSVPVGFETEIILTVTACLLLLRWPPPVAAAFYALSFCIGFGDSSDRKLVAASAALLQQSITLS